MKPDARSQRAANHRSEVNRHPTQSSSVPLPDDATTSDRLDSLEDQAKQVTVILVSSDVRAVAATRGTYVYR